MSEVEWVPEFEGQRPPFQPGHELSPATHGAYSPRKVEPLAREFVELLLTDDTVPAYAKAPAYRAELWALGRAEGQVQLLSEWLTIKGEETGDGIGDLGDERVKAAYLLLHRAEGRATSARTRLGLTPIAAARLGRDKTAAAVDMAQLMRLAAEDEKRRQQEETGDGED